MKITIATGPWLPVPALQGGAIPRMWQGLAEEFVNQGHEVCIFARSYPGQVAEEIVNGVRFLRWGGFQQSVSIKKDLAKDFLYAGCAVWRLPQADILVTNAFWLPVLAGMFRSDAGKIVVNANRFPKGQYWLYAQASRIAAASTAIRDAVVYQTPSLDARTKVFPNPINVQLLKPTVQVRGLSVPKTLLFVGRLHPEKGVHVLVEAFRNLAARHTDWRLQLVGPIAEHQGGGGTAYEKQLFDLAHGLPVEFTGPVFDATQLAAIYKNGSLFCYPSLAETGEALPVAPLEAMATGLVPIVSEIACFQDYIFDGESGFYFNHRAADPAFELAAKLDQIMRDHQKRINVGNCAASVAQEFSYPKIAEAFLADFEYLIGNKA